MHYMTGNKIVNILQVSWLNLQSGLRIPISVRAAEGKQHEWIPAETARAWQRLTVAQERNRDPFQLGIPLYWLNVWIVPKACQNHDLGLGGTEYNVLPWVNLPISTFFHHKIRKNDRHHTKVTEAPLANNSNFVIFLLCWCLVCCSPHRPLPQNKTSPRYGGDAIRSLRMWMITGDTDVTRGMTSLEYMRTPRYVMKP